MRREIRLPLTASGRLDRALADALGLGRATVKRAAFRPLAGVRDLRGRRARASDPVEPGALVAIDVEEPAGPPEPEPDASLAVLVEAPRLVVVDKPAGVAVHRSRRRGGTLMNAVAARYPECADASPILARAEQFRASTWRRAAASCSRAIRRRGTRCAPASRRARWRRSASRSSRGGLRRASRRCRSRSAAARGSVRTETEERLLAKGSAPAGRDALGGRAPLRGAHAPARPDRHWRDAPDPGAPRAPRLPGRRRRALRRRRGEPPRPAPPVPARLAARASKAPTASASRRRARLRRKPTRCSLTRSLVERERPARGRRLRHRLGSAYCGAPGREWPAP